MKIWEFENEDAWFDARLGKITGTKAGKLYSKRDGKPLSGFWELAVEKLEIKSDENRMDRGKRLEEYAVDRFVEETGKKVIYKKVLCCREDEPDIAYSPDALLQDEPASIEVKCLKSLEHLQAYLKQEIPSEYKDQSIQPFVVNDELETLYFVFYNPDFVKDFFYFEIKRSDVAEQVAKQLDEQRVALAAVREIEKKLTF
jgi:predicted phage-related endonuclease